VIIGGSIIVPPRVTMLCGQRITNLPTSDVAMLRLEVGTVNYGIAPRVMVTIDLITVAVAAILLGLRWVQDFWVK